MESENSVARQPAPTVAADRTRPRGRAVGGELDVADEFGHAPACRRLIRHGLPSSGGIGATVDPADLSVRLDALSAARPDAEAVERNPFRFQPKAPPPPPADAKPTPPVTNPGPPPVRRPGRRRRRRFR